MLLIPINSKIGETMKVKLIAVGKTEDSYLKAGIDEYEKRIRRYIPFESHQLTGAGNPISMNQKEIIRNESEKVQKYLGTSDFVIVLDEKGKEFRSVEFSSFLGQKFNSSVKSIIFIIGGPFGIHESLKARANLVMSLSKLTFSHQMVRLFFSEQLYRALTLLNNESYHHED